MKEEHLLCEHKAVQRTVFRTYLLILALAATWRIYLFRTGRLAFNSDGVIPDTGALRILKEGKLLIMWPGQNYGRDIASYYYASGA